MTKVNWYPGHMAKAKRKIKENLAYIDVVFELVDARIPASSKVKEFDDLLKNKKRILVFTKYDLCDKKRTDEWIRFYQTKGYQTITFNLLEDKVTKLLTLAEELLADEVARRAEKGVFRAQIRALVIGVPNVGKSTLINRLVAKKATKVANRPGITRAVEWIRINKKVALLDTPGILSPRYDTDQTALNLAAFLAIKEELIPLEAVIYHVLEQLNRYYPQIWQERYQITSFASYEELLDLIGRKRGCLVKGGKVDQERAMLVILNDIRAGKITGITFDIKE